MGFHVQQEIVGIVMIAIMFFLSFVALITGIYLKHFKLNSARFLNIAAFLALSGIWFLSDSALAQEYTSFPALTGMYFFLCIYADVSTDGSFCKKYTEV